jgi:energy-coupling factor transporter ATP-binding protein EcfA2
MGFRFHPNLDGDAELRRIAGETLQHRATLIVGPHGSGKTTLLHDLAPALQSQFQQVHRILLHSPTSPGAGANRRQQRENAALVAGQQRTATKNSLLIIDGMEQLAATTRWRILRRAKHHGHHLLATSHRQLRGLNTIFETSSDARIIAALTSMLIKNSPLELRRAIDAELCRRHPTTVVNVRELWFDLYDVAANFPALQTIQTGGGDATLWNSTTAK